MRPMLLGGIVVVGLVLGLLLGPWLHRTWTNFQPVLAVSTVQAVAQEMPVFVEVPTLTPSLTPSITPTPTNTPTPTPTPSLTPTPTFTPTPTETPTPTPTHTPTPTPTRVWPTWTPVTPTSTPAPTSPPLLSAPLPLKPENGTVYSGEDVRIELTWASDHTLSSSEYFEVVLRYVSDGAEVRTPVHVQRASWFVDPTLHGKADQSTERAYHWTVRLVRKRTGSGGDEEYTPISATGQEMVFYWK